MDRSLMCRLPGLPAGGGGAPWAGGGESSSKVVGASASARRRVARLSSSLSLPEHPVLLLPYLRRASHPGVPTRCGDPAAVLGAWGGHERESRRVLFFSMRCARGVLLRLQAAICCPQPFCTGVRGRGVDEGVRGG